MDKQQVDAIRDATVKAFAAQVKRVLSIMRVRGWGFPDGCDVAVKVVRASALSMDISARIDDISTDATITTKTSGEELSKIVETLVGRWLATHATTLPKQHGAVQNRK